jgi:K+ transporter
MVMVIGLVLVFRSSSNLAVAYGISVSATMLIDTLLLALVARMLWPRARHWIVALCLGFLVVDVASWPQRRQAAAGRVVPGGAGRVLFTMMRHLAARPRELLREEIRKDGIRWTPSCPG